MAQLPVPNATLFSGKTAVDAGTPSSSVAPNAWVSNPRGYKWVRIQVTVAGAPTACNVRAYVRVGGSGGVVTRGPLVGIDGTSGIGGMDLYLWGDDWTLNLETLTAGSSPAVSCVYSFRDEA